MFRFKETLLKVSKICEAWRLVGGERGKENLSKKKPSPSPSTGTPLEGFEGFKPTVVQGEHVKGDAGLPLLQYLPEITHP